MSQSHTAAQAANHGTSAAVNFGSHQTLAVPSRGKRVGDASVSKSIAAAYASCSRWASSLELPRYGRSNNHLNSREQPCSAEKRSQAQKDNLEAAAQAPGLCFLMLQETLTLLLVGRAPGKEAAIWVIPYAVALMIAVGCLPSRPLDPFLSLCCCSWARVRSLHSAGQSQNGAAGMDPEGEVATVQPMAAAESPVRPAACADAVLAFPCCAGDAVVLWWQGRRTAVTRDHNGLQLEQLPDTGCLSWCTGPASVQYGEAKGLAIHHPGQPQAAHAAAHGTKQCSDYS